MRIRCCAKLSLCVVPVETQLIEGTREQHLYCLQAAARRSGDMIRGLPFPWAGSVVPRQLLDRSPPDLNPHDGEPRRCCIGSRMAATPRAACRSSARLRGGPLPPEHSPVVHRCDRCHTSTAWSAAWNLPAAASSTVPSTSRTSPGSLIKTPGHHHAERRQRRYVGTPAAAAVGHDVRFRQSQIHIDERA